ncbi:MAG: hypothetical protein AAF702_47530 [Chloroflexota bacterium]
MAEILFITCNRWPNISQSDMLLANSLRKRGHSVESVPWQGDFTRLQAADLLLLRSNWDYHYDLPGFTAWLDQIEAARLPIYNPISLVRWNLHKSYLFDLEAQRILIPKTQVLNKDEAVEPIFEQQGWTEAIIKPLVGASSHLVERVSRAALATWCEEIRPQRADEAWLIQEFRPEIQETGEWSLIFFAGDFSHAVVKQPSAGEFKLNSQYAGQIKRTTPASSLLQQAQQVVAGLPLIPLYARIDGFVSKNGDFLVLELELNEPGLYFTFAPEQANHFAEVIHALL